MLCGDAMKRGHALGAAQELDIEIGSKFGDNYSMVQG